MKNLGQISRMLAILLTSAAVLGLIVWRLMPAESVQATLPQPNMFPSTAQTSAIQRSTAVAPVGVSVTEPAGAAGAVVAESGKESAEDLHDHDAQNNDEKMEPPSPEIINAIRDMKKPTPDEGQVIQNPDGSMKLKLGNRLQSVPIATIGKDGKVHVDYHGEKYAQDSQSVQENQPVENSKPEEKKQEAATP